MRQVLTALLLAAFAATGQTPTSAIETEIERIDRLAADQDLKLQVLHTMARELGTHRNRLIMLKKQTGESFGRIFVRELRARGADDRAVLAKLRGVTREFESGDSQESARIRPILFFTSTADRNSAGTYITLAPEAGIDTRHAAFVVGVPLYRISASQLDATGVGDAYAAAFLRRRAGRYDLGSSVTLGLPTGDRDKGLGAGKVTVDLNATVERRFEYLRPFFAGGFTNSVFNSVGYQRPFISNGNAWYAAGGLDAQVHRRVVAGAGAFALHALGTHTVISRMNQSMPPGHEPGGHGMPGHGTPHPRDAPFYGHAGETSVSGTELSDHGGNAWLRLSLHRNVSLYFAAARSIPYELTTIRAGLGFDLAGILVRTRRAR